MATRPGEVFHTDIGVSPIASFSDYRYFIVFVDESTRYVFTLLMRKRDEVYHVYEDLRRKFRDKIKCINTVVSEYDDEIKRMQCDNGKEYEKLARIIVKQQLQWKRPYVQRMLRPRNEQDDRGDRPEKEHSAAAVGPAHAGVHVHAAAVTPALGRAVLVVDDELDELDATWRPTFSWRSTAAS
ncbi:hypothetical protein PF003_g8983 [Phytophthora fragariae]|nr:hypothetical protein PF003_g8983 [Phytophthora fragariae]